MKSCYYDERRYEHSRSIPRLAILVWLISQIYVTASKAIFTSHLRAQQPNTSLRAQVLAKKSQYLPISELAMSSLITQCSIFHRLNARSCTF